ncbi:MAG: hypothetical protein R3F11_12795 [Verrucomicrobiales bacterium]
MVRLAVGVGVQYFAPDAAGSGSTQTKAAYYNQRRDRRRLRRDLALAARRALRRAGQQPRCEDRPSTSARRSPRAPRALGIPAIRSGSAQ